MQHRNAKDMFESLSTSDKFIFSFLALKNVFVTILCKKKNKKQKQQQNPEYQAV